MSAHTPGPWYVHVNDFGDAARRFVWPDESADRDYCVATIQPCTQSAARYPASPAAQLAELEANARLIAAAPALLAALRIVADCVADSDGGTTLGSYEMGKVRAALAKADVCLPTVSKVST